VPTSPVTVPPMVKLATQLTVTLVMLAEAVPLPLVTVQIWFGVVGWVLTVTA